MSRQIARRPSPFDAECVLVFCEAWCNLVQLIASSQPNAGI
jgi:hypothetical protein